MSVFFDFSCILLLIAVLFLFVKLKKKINADKEQHIQEVQMLKNELYAINEQISDKNNHIKNLTEKISILENVVKEKEDMFERTNQELTVS